MDKTAASSSKGTSLDDATVQAKKGCRIYRKPWKTENKWLVYLTPGKFSMKLTTQDVPKDPFFAQKNDDNTYTPWIPGTDDSHSKDWCVETRS
jgi:Protein of unknown function (DUF2829)